MHTENVIDSRERNITGTKFVKWHNSKRYFHQSVPYAWNTCANTFFSWALQFWDLIFSLFVSEKIWYTSYSKTHLRMQITTALLSDISAFMKKGASVMAAETHSYNYV